MTTDTIGGVWRYSLELARNLEKHNVQVLLATFGPLPTEDQLNEVRELSGTSLYSVPYKLEWMHAPWEDLEKSQRWLLNLTFTLNPDVLHFNSFAFDTNLFQAPSVMVGHSCVLSWWEKVKNEPAPPQWERYAKIVRRGLQSANMVVAPSKFMLKNLQKYYGPLPHTKVIYNASNPTFFHIDEKQKYIFSMGRLWDEAKNIKFLIEAARHLHYPVFIAGDSHNKLDKTLLPPNVTLLGQLNKKQIAGWLSKASVFVMPSLYEPFGLSALEAAFSGCALLLGRIPSAQEIWKDYALYFDPHQPSELISLINKIMADDKFRNKISRKAIIGASVYEPDKMTEEYLSLYQMLKQEKRNEYSVLSTKY